jgi:hypothetical protein
MVCPVPVLVLAWGSANAKSGASNSARGAFPFVPSFLMSANVACAPMTP